MNQVDLLTDILAREGAEALGWEHGRPCGSVARSLLRPAARRIAREFAACDEVFASRALPDAARWTLDRFSARVEVAGLDRVPRRGPILLVANHPGLTDAVSLVATLGRADLRIVAADYPFLHAMRGLASRLIFLGPDGTSQLSSIRAASRDLRNGGAVLLFPAGRLEPDPAVLGRVGAL
ncbi:MAG: 1-acyl-sn-glycerol-3-phosphate acyltransferase, partial [Candidatus Limnocylindria bacterium]